MLCLKRVTAPFLTTFNRRQVMFGQIGLAEHVHVHGGGPVDDCAPERKKGLLRNLLFGLKKKKTLIQI